MRRVLIGIIVGIFIFLSNINSFDQTVYAEEDAPYVSGRVIVKFKSEAVFDTLEKSRLGIASLEKVFEISEENDLIHLDRMYRLNVSAGTEKQSIEKLQLESNVEFAELDYQAKATIDPNDPYYLFDDVGNTLWYQKRLHVSDTWDIQKGSSYVVIALIDSGIALQHEDLKGKIWENPGEIAGNSIDDDHNGYIDDVSGWNVYSNTSDVADQFGHGTLVSGIAGASTNNNNGITSIGWKSMLLPVKATVGGTGIMNYSDMAKAIIYADLFPSVRVINISFGGYSNSNVVRIAITNVLMRNKSVIVTATGNESWDTYTKPFYPSSYRGVLSVTGYQKGLAHVYNYGYPTSVAAPAVNIFTTFLGQNNDYGYASGTSLAAPFVSGLASLMAANYPNWKASDIAQSIQFWASCPPTVSKCTELKWTPQYGYGIIDPLRTIKARCDDREKPLRTTVAISDPSERATYGSPGTFDINGTVTSNNFLRYDIQYGSGASPSSWLSDGITLTHKGNQTVVNGKLGSWDYTKAPASGTYQLRVRVYGDNSCTNNLIGEARGLVSVVTQ